MKSQRPAGTRVPFTTFAATMLGLTFTRGQLVLAKVLFDGTDPIDLPADERAIALEMFGPVDRIPRSARKMLVARLGRGSGKSTIAAAVAVHQLVTADLSKCGPGDVPTVVVVAPLRTLARYVLRMARELVRELVRRAPRHVAVTKDTSIGFQLRRPDGRIVALETFAASKATGRGASIITAILEESEFFAGDDAYATTDTHVWRAIVPRLIGPGIFISTPWPTPTLTGSLVASDFAAPCKALIAKASTLLMRDHDPDLVAMIDAERLRDSENVDREFFVLDGDGLGSGTFFDHIAIEAAVVNGIPLSLPAPPGSTLTIVVDLALTADSSAMAALARLGDRYTLCHLEELRPSKGKPLKPSEVIATFAAIALRFGVHKIHGDIHYKESAKELLAPYRIEFVELPAGVTGKQAMYTDARTILHEGRLTMPRHARLIAQLRDVRSAPLPGGATRIWSPRRTGLAHGDNVSALCGALHVAKGPYRIPFKSSDYAAGRTPYRSSGLSAQLERQAVTGRSGAFGGQRGF